MQCHLGEGGTRFARLHAPDGRGINRFSGVEPPLTLPLHREYHMAAKKRSTVVGVFADRRDADQSVAELKRAGFRDDQIGVAMRHAEASTESAETGDTYAEEGAATGLVAGLGLGALAGVGVLAGVIPVVGPAIVGG